MFSCKELCRSLACFVIGGIITVVILKILEWQRYQNPHEEWSEGRIIAVPIQEVGDGERQEERIVQEYTVQITKFRENKTNFKVLLRTFVIHFFLTKLESGACMQR